MRDVPQVTVSKTLIKHEILEEKIFHVLSQNLGKHNSCMIYMVLNKHASFFFC